MTDRSENSADEERPEHPYGDMCGYHLSGSPAEHHAEHTEWDDVLQIVTHHPKEKRSAIGKGY